jgi:hypothetical protein
MGRAKMIYGRRYLRKCLTQGKLHGLSLSFGTGGETVAPLALHGRPAR